MYKYVMQKLQDHKGEWITIAKKLKLPYWWLTKIACGQIPNPGIHRIQKLHDYFQKIDHA